MPAKLLSTREVAARLNVSPRRVQALVTAGRLKPQKVGKSFVFAEADLRSFEKRPGGRPRKAG